ncbi:hydroxyacylglutathione hydrolase [Luteimonas cucumeris]|uniref:Hydroxyacylglutathione hydrolase n=1 Tax=Luteimonas cucumeris TaxID=985012 RepID=A0A562L701_9GAMM|nr:hydroxyacylglutathione hydrolase [Luteimonas cucumeris]TWI03457.1 hydroxyacylglutathione hydrolase [Luteimonas cucumeris]
MRLQALPAFSDNYIWIWADDGGRALVVDPGEAGPVLAAAEQGLTPVAILLTHHHDDHIGGVPDLLRRWPALPVLGPDDPRITVATGRVGDGHRGELLGQPFDVLAVPGHTRSHIAFHFPGQGNPLFCGDTLFSLGCGRMFEGTPAQMLASLDRLAALPADTAVCCGHEYTLANACFARTVEPANAALAAREAEAITLRESRQPTVPSTLAQERDTNPFLRVDEQTVHASVTAHAGRAPADRVETFAELRRWKDGFRA